MPNRTRKPAITTNDNHNPRKVTIGIGLLPNELAEFDALVKAESQGGIAATRSTLGRYILTKYTKEKLKKQEAT